ncbi:MAG: hypothetical protein K940chlam3_00111 [Chlamydiae bacterium]|nr:hypothetical protein [Chlamydiota bacterium]
MSYLGCIECIAEKRKDASKIEISGNVLIAMGGKCIHKCLHHDINLEWVEGEDVITEGGLPISRTNPNVRK